MVWLAYIFAASLSNIPRIIPLNPHNARFILNVWLKEAIANEDKARVECLQSMVAFERHSTRNKGTIAVIVEGDVCAIAQLSTPPFTLMGIETSHMRSSYGTLLVKAISATALDLHLSPTLNARWRIAHGFFSHYED